MQSNQYEVIVLKKGREGPLMAGHPWVFSGAIHKVSSGLKSGCLVRLETHDRQFIAWGLFNDKSQITVRLYSWNEEVVPGPDLWRNRLRQAVDLRCHGLNLDPAKEALRLVYSEADDLSGLIVDVYAGWVSMMWTSLALASFQDVILDELVTLLSPKGIYLRTEKGIGELEGLKLQDGLLRGRQLPATISVKENGLKLKVDVMTGHKTGFYLDQRDNRKAVGAYVKDKRVLDVCCYTGGFALMAAKMGASQVVGIDAKKEALDLARDNARLNKLEGIEWHQGDVFEQLKKRQAQGDLFDVVIVDPPKFTRSKGTLSQALEGYKRLNQLALSVLAPRGILVSCSCSGHVGREDFMRLLALVAMHSGRSLKILEQRGQAPDHPIKPACPESDYLKSFICRVD